MVAVWLRNRVWGDGRDRKLRIENELFSNSTFAVGTSEEKPLGLRGSPCI